jgi:cell migration-inducing and hyaluronan-binding protein
MNRQLFTCISGRNKTLREWIDITGVRCRNFCPKAAPFGTRETFNRLWSNVTQWPNKVLPKEGDNVTIPYEWNIVLDMSPPEFYYVHINGLLYFDDTQDLTFKAYTIWVDLGGIYIGTAANPYQHQATITLNGGINDLYTVIDPDASGNKMLAVTGALEFYGKPLTNIWTRLAAIGKVGDTSITVLNATEWNVGNEIVIGATYTGYKEDEVFQITGITGNVLTLNASLIYEHYGDPQAITNSHGGVIDVRAAVGMLSRNIKITKGSTPSDWGCKILVYSYIV